MQTVRIILIELILNTQLRGRPCRPQSRRSVVTSAANITQPFNSTGTSKKIHPHPRSQLTESRKQEKKRKKRRLSDHDALLRELVLNAGRLHPVQKNFNYQSFSLRDALRDVQHRQHPVRPAELQGAAAATPERPGGFTRRPLGISLHRLQWTIFGHMRALSHRDPAIERRNQNRI